MKKIAVVDIAWGTGITLACLLSFLLKSGESAVMPILLIILWGIRLSSYMIIRSLKSSGDDKRYLEMAANWKGSFALNSYFRIFFLQGVLQFIMGLFYFYRSELPIDYHHPIVIVGFSFSIFGLIYESMADYTLFKFKKNHQGLCSLGVWKFSRHPNYFGEILFWWGLYMVHFPQLLTWQIISPLFITITILKVSGPPLIEKHYDRENNSHYFNKNSIIPDIRIFFRKEE